MVSTELPYYKVYEMGVICNILGFCPSSSIEEYPYKFDQALLTWIMDPSACVIMIASSQLNANRKRSDKRTVEAIRINF